MDSFSKAGMKYVGMGGIKCQCCFDFNSTRGKKGNFSKLRRNQFKKETESIVWQELEGFADNLNSVKSIKIK